MGSRMGDSKANTLENLCRAWVVAFRMSGWCALLLVLPTYILQPFLKPPRPHAVRAELLYTQAQKEWLDPLVRVFKNTLSTPPASRDCQSTSPAVRVFCKQTQLVFRRLQLFDSAQCLLYNLKQKFLQCFKIWGKYTFYKVKQEFLSWIRIAI